MATRTKQHNGRLNGVYMPAGRPKGKVTSDDVIDELLDKLSEGKPLTRICRDKRMPCVASVYSWVANDSEFASLFHDARARGVHALAEECLDIADEPTTDAVEVADKRVRIDTRLRLAGKWLSSVYGDKTLHGSDPENPLPSGFDVRLINAKSDG